MITLIELIFALILTLLLIAVGWLTRKPIMHLSAGLFSIVILGYVASSGSIILNEVYNVSTSTWVTYIVPVYPIILLVQAMIVVMCFLVLLISL